MFTTDDVAGICHTFGTSQCSGHARTGCLVYLCRCDRHSDFALLGIYRAIVRSFNEDYLLRILIGTFIQIVALYTIKN